MGCCTERVKSEAVTEVNLGADGGANIYAKTEGESESYRDTIASSLHDEKPEKRSPKNKAELKTDAEEEEAPAKASKQSEREEEEDSSSSESDNPSN